MTAFMEGDNDIPDYFHFRRWEEKGAQIGYVDFRKYEDGFVKEARIQIKVIPVSGEEAKKVHAKTPLFEWVFPHGHQSTLHETDSASSSSYDLVESINPSDLSMKRTPSIQRHLSQTKSRKKGGQNQEVSDEDPLWSFLGSCLSMSLPEKDNCSCGQCQQMNDCQSDADASVSRFQANGEITFNSSDCHSIASCRQYGGSDKKFDGRKKKPFDLSASVEPSAPIKTERTRLPATQNPDVEHTKASWPRPDAVWQALLNEASCKTQGVASVEERPDDFEIKRPVTKKNLKSKNQWNAPEKQVPKDEIPLRTRYFDHKEDASEFAKIVSSPHNSGPLDMRTSGSQQDLLDAPTAPPHPPDEYRKFTCRRANGDLACNTVEKYSLLENALAEDSALERRQSVGAKEREKVTCSMTNHNPYSCNLRFCVYTDQDTKCDRLLEQLAVELAKENPPIDEDEIVHIACQKSGPGQWMCHRVHVCTKPPGMA